VLRRSVEITPQNGYSPGSSIETYLARRSETDLPSAVAKLEAAMIRKELAACGGNRAEAALRLNINRQLLYTKMQHYCLVEP